MTYRPEWKGRLRYLYVEGRGQCIEWDGQILTYVKQVDRPGAKSPGGMVTDKVWVATGGDGSDKEYPSLTTLIEAVIKAAPG